MVRYYCTWCGNTAKRNGRNETVRCGRCVQEAVRLFHYWPWTVMIPLEPGERPPPPRASRRRFEFRDVRSHQVTGRTEVVAGPRLRLKPVPL
jgi:hypothetical protein